MPHPTRRPRSLDKSSREAPAGSSGARSTCAAIARQRSLVVHGRIDVFAKQRAQVIAVRQHGPHRLAVDDLPFGDVAAGAIGKDSANLAIPCVRAPTTEIADSGTFQRTTSP